MQGIDTYIPKTKHVLREHHVAAVLVLLFMVLISLVLALTQMYLYVSTFRSA
jgi:DNA-binding transcriptional regulator of glucitol operon